MAERGRSAEQQILGATDARARTVCSDDRSDPGRTRSGGGGNWTRQRIRWPGEATGARAWLNNCKCGELAGSRCERNGERT